MKQIPPLNIGDKICIVAPAGKINPDTTEKAAQNLKNLGYQVKVYPSALGAYHYFSGTQTQRLNDLQSALNDEDCKAILFARGGYGTVHLLESLDWSGFEKTPKYIVGFSDITMLHSILSNKGYESIHGGMAKEFADDSNSAKLVLELLSGKRDSVEWKGLTNKTGTANGKLAGGNLAILCSLLGTPFAPDFKNKILFIEEVGEYLYKINRMLWQLKLAGAFSQIKGVVLGQFTDISDTTAPYGMELHEMIFDELKEYNIPIATGLNSGHGELNMPLLMGAELKLEVGEAQARLAYLNAH